MEVKNMEAQSIIGFNGTAISGLKVHPSGKHIIYPMGNKVCIQDWTTKTMSFLSGHSNTIVTVAISVKGNFIGSGQINHIGFQAPCKIWDFEKKVMIGSHDLHKVRVEALAFTTDEKYLVSLGGRDDGTVVLWDVKAAAATGTATATMNTAGDALAIAPLKLRFNSFVTGGDGNLRIWNIKPETKNLEVTDVSMGKLRRMVVCVAVSSDDTYGFAGTTSGDIIKFSINYPSDPKALVSNIKCAIIGCFTKCGALKKGAKPEGILYSKGVTSILLMADGCLIVGSGGGTIDLLEEFEFRGNFAKPKINDPNKPHFKVLRTVKLDGSITSLQLMESPALRGDKRVLVVGTQSCEIYTISVATFEPILAVTCHKCAINDIAFPHGMSGVFATAGAGDVRVWCVATSQELLRISVPNFTCSSVLFSADGKSIVSGWNDGNIRAFTPLTGRLMYCIYNTHNKGTSALALTRDGRTLVSGGCEGQVRLWDILPHKQSLKKVLKEHKSPVSAIVVSPQDTEAVSAGTDGSCIIWDLVSLSRRQVMYANTLFMCVAYEPTGCQLLTGGTDRRVAYWETGSGNLARELEASKTGAVNGLDITADGKLFVTGSNDQTVKLWKYEEGIYTHVGLGHAGAVSCCRFSPDGAVVVSCCAAGTVIIWRMPQVYEEKKGGSARASGVGVGGGEAPPSQRSDDLKLPLETKGSGDRLRPNKPTKQQSKEEKICSMDTGRSSVHATCPCAAASDPDKGRMDHAASVARQCCRPAVNVSGRSGGGDKR